MPAASRARSGCAETASGKSSPPCASSRPRRPGASRRARGRRTSAGSRRARTTRGSSSSVSSSGASCAPRTGVRRGRTTVPAPSAMCTRWPGMPRSPAAPTRPRAGARHGAATTARPGSRRTTDATAITRGRSLSTRKTPTAGSSRPRRGRSRRTAAVLRGRPSTAGAGRGPGRNSTSAFPARSRRCRTRLPQPRRDSLWRSATGGSSGAATRARAGARWRPRASPESSQWLPRRVWRSVARRRDERRASGGTGNVSPSSPNSRTRRGGGTKDWSRSARAAPGRATGTCPRGRRHPGRMPNTCGRRRRPRARMRSSLGPRVYR
jgi:hypothetical protein